MTAQRPLGNPIGLKHVWSQVPLGFLLLITGAVNIMTGLQIHGPNALHQVLTQVVPLSELSQEVSLGILGNGVQVLLGGGLLVTGLGLFWRLRSAWAFSILLLLAALAVDLSSHRPAYHVLPPGLALVALIIWQGRFERRSRIGGYLMSFIGLLAVFGYGILGSLLLGARFQPGIHDPYTALYFTVVTLSTVGSNIYPATPEAKLFMVTLILGGISIFTTTIVTTLGPLLSTHVKPLLSGRKGLANPGPGLILIGSGLFASSVALDLTTHGIGFIQLVAPGSSPPMLGQLVVWGDPSDEGVLRRAGIQDSFTVLVAGDDDASNASAALAAKRLNRAARVVVMASSSEAMPGLRAAQADVVFAPTAVGARLAVRLVGGDPIPRELEDLFEGRTQD